MSRYFVTAARGVELLTAAELRSPNINATKTEEVPGGVYFEGNHETLYRAHLWLRTGNRILLPLREFPVRDPQELYENVHKFKWETFFRGNETLSVDCTISGQKTPDLSHSQFAKLKVKDAIVDRLREKKGSRPNVDPENPDISVSIYIRDGNCVLNMDATGKSLHERGYRPPRAEAPLKETLAASIMSFTGWDGTVPLIDPMCGSGTLLIEAAMMAGNVAPGLFQKRFSFMNWPDFYAPLWTELCAEAERVRKPIGDDLIFGFDGSRQAIHAAEDSATLARFSEKEIQVRWQNLERLQPCGNKPGYIVVNPPYGERLGDVEELKALYKNLGDIFKQRFKGWTAFIFTGNSELAKAVGLKTSRRIELFNGPIECRLLRYYLY